MYTPVPCDHPIPDWGQLHTCGPCGNPLEEHRVKDLVGLIAELSRKILDTPVVPPPPMGKLTHWDPVSWSWVETA